MSNEEIEHILRDLMTAHSSIDRAIDWCDCANDYIVHDVVNHPTIDEGIMKTVLAELENAKCSLQSYMTELNARRQ